MQQCEQNGISYISGSGSVDPEKPTLVFIHGASQNAMFWKEQIQALATVANTVAVDLPGHGKSPGPGKTSIRDYALAVSRFLDALNPPRPVVCGLSMGGAVVQELLTDPGHGFHGAILMNTGAKLKTTPMIFDIIEKGHDDFMNLLFGFAISQKNNTDEIRERVLESSQCSTQTAIGDFRACDGFDIRERLQSITAQVLVMTASDDILTPPAYGEFLVKSILGATGAIIRDAGHLSPIEKPMEVIGVIRDFLLTLH